MKEWKTGDVIQATDVNRWEESVAVFTTTVGDGNVTINDIGYDELKTLIMAGRSPRVVYTFEFDVNRTTAVESLWQIAVEADAGGTPTAEYIESTPTQLQFKKQSDGSAMATL